MWLLQKLYENKYLIFNHETDDSTWDIVTTIEKAKEEVKNRNITNPHGRELPKGVCLHKGKYRAYIRINNKQINLGSFDTKEEAIKARQEAELSIDFSL